MASKISRVSSTCARCGYFISSLLSFLAYTYSAANENYTVAHDCTRREGSVTKIRQGPMLSLVAVLVAVGVVHVYIYSALRNIFIYYSFPRELLWTRCNDSSNRAKCRSRVAPAARYAATHTLSLAKCKIIITRAYALYTCSTTHCASILYICTSAQQY